jgi:hypothetical protein
MGANTLRHFNEKVLDWLKANIETNLERYLNGNFTDLLKGEGWSISTNVDYAPSAFADLKPEVNPQAEIQSSAIIATALPHFTARLASEERFLARLTHVDGLEYTRQRWIKRAAGKEALISSIRKHFFAEGRPGRRDDNGIGRLWWNWYMARRISPENPMRALNVFLQGTDRRLNFVERPRTVIRTRLSAGIIRLAGRDDAIFNEKIFRLFMPELNIAVAGSFLEIMSDDEIDMLVRNCFEAVKARAAAL